VFFILFQSFSSISLFQNNPPEIENQNILQFTDHKDFCKEHKICQWSIQDVTERSDKKINYAT